MITPDEALDLVIRTAAPLPPKAVHLDEALGLVLAEDIHADGDYPPFPRSMMDGFAVRLADAGKRVPVVGEVPAGSVWEGEVAAGQCVEILTGAPCPCGAEAVVPKEHVERHENFVVLPSPIRPGQNIAPQGSDCRRGQRVLAAGQIVTSMAIATIASFGRASVRATPRPTLALITTGAELAGPEQPLRPGQIRNSNGPMLRAMARDLGLSAPRAWHAADRLEATVQALQEAADADIVVLSGGVSVGTYDFVPQALARIGAETLFHGVKQKPGKPLLFARKGPRLFFGLPGNPLSCHFVFHRYVRAGNSQDERRPSRATRISRRTGPRDRIQRRPHALCARPGGSRRGLGRRMARGGIARGQFGRHLPELPGELLCRDSGGGPRLPGRRSARLHLAGTGTVGRFLTFQRTMCVIR